MDKVSKEIIRIIFLALAVVFIQYAYVGPSTSGPLQTDAGCPDGY